MGIQELILSTLLIFSICASASDAIQSAGDDLAETPPVSLSELAARADLVAVAQVKDTDYVYTRSFPSEGVAILEVLISYKMNRTSEDFIEVYEKGLHANECYFEDPPYTSEGRRYLVFLKIDPEDPEYYRGLEQGCALEIFVTEGSGYALKYPLEGISLTDKLDEFASAFTFHDNHALVSEDALSPVNRDDLLKRDLIIPYREQFKYTHGIDLTTVRNQINVEALKSKPHQ